MARASTSTYNMMIWYMGMLLRSSCSWRSSVLLSAVDGWVHYRLTLSLLPHMAYRKTIVHDNNKIALIRSVRSSGRCDLGSTSQAVEGKA